MKIAQLLNAFRKFYLRNAHDLGKKTDIMQVLGLMQGIQQHAYQLSQNPEKSMKSNGQGGITLIVFEKDRTTTETKICLTYTGPIEICGNTVLMVFTATEILLFN